MTEVLQTNVFFMITSFAVIIVTALLVILLIYFIYILRNISRISDTVRRSSEEIAKDVDTLRGEIKEKGSSIWSIIGFIIKKFKNTKKHGK